MYHEGTGDLLERLAVHLSADPTPPPVFAGGEATMNATGWLLWNLTANQPQQLHRRATCQARNRQREVPQAITIAEEATRHRGKLVF